MEPDVSESYHFIFWPPTKLLKAAFCEIQNDWGELAVGEG
jgi:hypothetical protein